jgi:vanillate O-demethylase monooxygenase subunit
MVLNTWAKPTGTERDSSCWASTLHNAVPADEDSSHYFFCSTRKFKLDDAAFNAMLREVLHRAFAEEDKPMLERQHVNLRGADFESLKPALLSIDNASARARRALARLIDAERASNTTAER